MEEYIEVCKSKIHRAGVTLANVDYEGSIGIDKAILKESDIAPFEKVQVIDLDNGNRLETYAIEEKEGSGIVGVYGGAARLVKAGDTVIIISYKIVRKGKAFQPIVVHVNEKNRIA